MNESLSHCYARYQIRDRREDGKLVWTLDIYNPKFVFKMKQKATPSPIEIPFPNSHKTLH